jgi:AcrR family transcriptional regulator
MNNSEERECSTKELILEATLNLIKREGFDGVTIRKIASEADVNVSLINYHFGSKDKLINKIIQMIANSFKESFAILDDDSIEPLERLKRFLIQYLHVYRQYPFIAQKFLDQEAVLFDTQNEFIRFIKAIGLKNLQRTIEQITGETDSETIMLMTSHLMGATFLPVLIEPLFEKVMGYPLPDEERRIELLLERYFQVKK